MLALAGVPTGSGTGISSSGFRPSGVSDSPPGGSATGNTPSFPVLSHYAVTGTVTDDQGGQVTDGITIGGPEIVLQISDPNAHDCDDQYQQDGTSADRAVAYPVNVTAKVTSSVALTAAVSLSTNCSVSSAGNLPPTNGPIYWDGMFDRTDQCSADAGILAEVNSEDLPPGQSYGWDAYLIVANAVTPDGLTRGNQDAGLVIIDPGVDMDGYVASYDIGTSHSQNLVSCIDSDTELATFVSVNPQVALANGCTA